MADGGAARDCVGCEVEVKTKDGEVHKGEVWDYDRASGIVSLKCASSSGIPGMSDVVLLRCNHIAEVLSAEAGPSTASASFPKIDHQKLERREARSIEAMERSIRSIGKGVSKEAQAVFDALEKTMPCDWREQTIVLYEGAIEIGPPYSLESCRFAGEGGENEMMMGRVKTVLEQELARQSSSGAAATNGAAD